MIIYPDTLWLILVKILLIDRIYPPGFFNIVIENGHRNSGIYPLNNGDFP